MKIMLIATFIKKTGLIYTQVLADATSGRLAFPLSFPLVLIIIIKLKHKQELLCDG